MKIAAKGRKERKKEEKKAGPEGDGFLGLLDNFDPL
jgi:hypothetical protein